MVSVETPTLNDPVKLTTLVFNPDTDIEVWLFNSKKGSKFAVTLLLSFQVNTAFSNFCKVVSILETPIPTISSTLALNPDPLVPELSKTVRSPTLYPSPPSKTVTSFISPFVTDSIFEICLIFSFDSIIKSLSPNSSSTRYGNVFLSRFELLKSKSWSKIRLSFIKGDL